MRTAFFRPTAENTAAWDAAIALSCNTRRLYRLFYIFTDSRGAA